MDSPSKATFLAAVATICSACGSGNDSQTASLVPSAAGGTSSRTSVITGGLTATGSRSNGGATVLGGASHNGGTSASAGARATTGGTKASSGGSKSTGGSGTVASSTLISNELEAIVDQGNSNYMNGLFVSVTLCVPGTTSCQTIDHVLVDTGSFGLRILESALTLSLPMVTNSAGSTLAECAQFVSGTAWGPLARADVRLGGKSAAGISVQTIGEGRFPKPDTASCTGVALNDATSLMSNGILGVGFFQQDCGAACASAATNPGIYLACTSNQAGGCKVTTVPVDQQVTNPIVAFSTDNNGLIIELPDVPEQGAESVTGKLVFGIGTQSNNGLGSATVFTPVDEYGYVGTSFPAGGTRYAGFLDSGSNAIYFLDAATSGLSECTSRLAGFYCPAATTSLRATIFGGSGTSVPVDFKVANVSRLSGAMAAFNNVAGEMPGFPSNDPGAVDYIWGLSFFYGRSVYTAIEKKATPSGTGPYVAF